MKKEPVITMNEWQAELEKIPVSSNKNSFTKDQDAQILWIYKNNRSVRSFIEWFQKKYGFGSRDSIKRRYKELTK